MLIGLTGYARSGKDTVADVLVETYGFRKIAFADALKDLALASNPYVWLDDLSEGGPGFARLADLVRNLGWEAAKAHPDVRGFLQHLGCGVRDHLDPDAWVRVVSERLIADGWNGHLSDARIVVPDVRFANEARWVATNGHLVRVVRPGVPPANGHYSETDLDGAKVSASLFNDDTLGSLVAKARLLPHELGGL